MSTDYVQARNGNLYVGPSRVTFDSIVTLWKSGMTPEAIRADFPTVPLAYVYGTIAYYLEYQEEMDRWLKETDEIDRARQAAQEAASPAFYAERRRRFAEARKQLGLDMTEGGSVSEESPAPAHPGESGASHELESPAR